jgi:hypothetical protein
MTVKALFRESTTAPLVKTGKRWRVVVAVPGQGSSGFYSSEVLKEYGPAALAPGSKAFFDHNPDRSIKDMVGTYPDGGVWDEENNVLIAELQPFKHWQEVIDEIGPHAEASIYMMGETDDKGNVIKLFPDRTNGVDLVGYGGLEGSGLKEQVEKLVMEAHAFVDKADSEASGQNKNEGKQMEKEILEAIKALSESLVPVVTFINESKTAKGAEVQATVDAEAVNTAVAEAVAAYDEKAALIEAAGLLPSQVESIRAAAKRGDDVADRIAEAKKVVDEAKALSGARVEETLLVGGKASTETYTMVGVL